MPQSRGQPYVEYVQEQILNPLRMANTDFTYSNEYTQTNAAGAAVLDFEMARKSNSGNGSFDDLKDNPLMIVRAGGVDAVATYLDKARDRNKSSVMGNWHFFNDIHPDQPQTRVLFLVGTEGGANIEVYRDLTSKEQGYIGIWGTHYRIPIEAVYGMRGDTSMKNMARYVAVAPRNASTSLRYLPFTT